VANVANGVMLLVVWLLAASRYSSLRHCPEMRGIQALAKTARN
jgi:hypothetical protein